MIRAWDSLWENLAASAELNPAQRYRHRFLLSLLDAPSRLVDVGCGQGDLLRLAATRFPDTKLRGIEPSPEGRRLTQEKCPSAELHEGDLQAEGGLPQGWAGWATAVVCSEVLEHLADPELATRRLSQLLEPGGTLYVSVPAGPMSAFDRHLGHQRHFTSASLASTLESAGFGNVRVWRAGFPFFNLYRGTVIARGKALLRDASSPGPIARAMMAAFDIVFRINLSDLPGGWQLFATAKRAI